MNDSDVLAELESDFQPPQNLGADAKPQPCRECYKEPVINPGCESCSEVDGDCLYCTPCGAKRMDRLIAGAIEIMHESRATGAKPTLHRPCKHDLTQMVYGMLNMIVSAAGDRVDELVAFIRETGWNTAKD